MTHISRKNILKATALTGLSRFGLHAQSNTLGHTHHTPKAKRIIYLFMAGGPSQIDMFDNKPLMQKMYNKDLPASIRQGQRVTNMTAKQSRFPIAPSIYKFKKHGQSGMEISELLPYMSEMVDEISLIKSMHTEAINHDPAKTMLCTGSQLPGMASLGAWVDYGLGSLNQNLPSFMVLNSTTVRGQGLYSRLWGSGFLPAKHQGVMLQSSESPVLYLNNPKGVSPKDRKKMLNLTTQLNHKHYHEIGDSEISTSNAQLDMAVRMQSTVPELTDTKSEPQYVKDLYGPDVDKPGTFAYNCLLARRMAEANVRSIQVFHRGWDQHSNLPKDISSRCRETDQACAGLLKDLKQRGLLEDTLVVWGGEFGRTIYSQGTLTKDNYGRDHHPRCFSMWLAGAGIKKGFTLGETDDFSYNIVKDPVHVRDLNATILNQLGLNHDRLTFPYNGLDMKLTGVEKAHLIKPILA